MWTKKLTYPIPNCPFLNCLPSGLSSTQPECKIHNPVHPLNKLWPYCLPAEYFEVNVVCLFLFNPFLSLSGEKVYFIVTVKVNGKIRAWFKHKSVWAFDWF